MSLSGSEKSSGPATDIRTSSESGSNRRVAAVGVAALGGIAGVASAFSVNTLPGFGDESSAPFLNGIELYSSPGLIFTKPFTTVDDFYLAGNFRPVGRFIEYLGQLCTWWIAQVADVPVFSAFSLTRALAAAFAGVCLAACIWQLSKHSLLAVLCGSGLAIGLSAVGDAPTAPLVVFPWLYLVSGGIATALIALSHVIAGRDDRELSRLKWFVGAIAVGIVAASTNEIVALAAVPVGACGMWRAVLRRRSRSQMRLVGNGEDSGEDLFFASAGSGERLVMLSAGASLAATLLIRAVLFVKCSSTDCYDASQASIRVPISLVVQRLAAPFSAVTTHPVKMAAIVGFLALGALVITAAGLGPVGLRRIIADRSLLLVAGLAMWASSTALSSLSVEVQTARFPARVQWREAVLAVPGAILVVVGLALVVVDLLPRRTPDSTPAAKIALGVLVVGLAWWTAVGTVRTNRSTARLWLAQPSVTIHLRLDDALHDFESTEAGSRNRCALFKELDSYQGQIDAWHIGQSHRAFDLASTTEHKVPYCADGG